MEKLIENIRRPHASEAIQRRQIDLLRRLNFDLRRHGANPRLESRIESFELAFRMQLEATEAFDIGKEPAHIRIGVGSQVCVNKCGKLRRGQSNQ